MRKKQMRTIWTVVAILAVVLVGFGYKTYKGMTAGAGVARGSVSAMYTILVMPPSDAPTPSGQKPKDPLLLYANADVVSKLHEWEGTYGRVQEFTIQSAGPGPGPKGWTAEVAANRERTKTVEKLVSEDGATVSKIEMTGQTPK